MCSLRASRETVALSRAPSSDASYPFRLALHNPAAGLWAALPVPAPHVHTAAASCSSACSPQPRAWWQSCWCWRRVADGRGALVPPPVVVLLAALCERSRTQAVKGVGVPSCHGLVVPWRTTSCGGVPPTLCEPGRAQAVGACACSCRGLLVLYLKR